MLIADVGVLVEGEEDVHQIAADSAAIWDSALEPDLKLLDRLENVSELLRRTHLGPIEDMPTQRGDLVQQRDSISLRNCQDLFSLARLDLLKSQRLKAFCALGSNALKASNQAVDRALQCS